MARMVLTGKVAEEIPIPPNVSVRLEGDRIRVEGPRGKLERSFRHPGVRIAQAEGGLVVSAAFPRAAEKAMVGTTGAHLRNMLHGVTEGFEYALKVVYSHFPVKVSVKGSAVIIENFLGEKSPRRAKIVGETKVTVKGAEILLQGPDLEAVGQTAANLERATRIKGFDPRVFQDGIYIVRKGGR